MRWALENDRMAAYHVYVEDDSFNCIENILHQCEILVQLNWNNSIIPIRAGTPMYDGFDDSSSFMSRSVENECIFAII